MIISAAPDAGTDIIFRKELMPRNESVFLTGDFVISAGCVLFRRSPDASRTLQICLIHASRDRWLLPKGRKDVGESIDVTAARETYEETGYVCELVPVHMPTRAPIPGDTRNVATVRENIREPIAISTRDVVKGTVKKLIWWFVGRVKRGSEEKVEGTQMAGESYESHFLDVAEALDRLSFPGDREVATLAARIVEDTEKESGEEIVF